jgi:ASC-1-like (ASCH) protein
MNTNTKGIIIKINGEDTKIEYTDRGTHILGLWGRPFDAIKNGQKSIEVRTNTAQIPFDFNLVKVGDKINFVNEQTGETLLTEVKNISKYDSAKEYLEKVGFAHSSSKPKTMEEAISAIESHTGYKEGITRYGLFAFTISLLHK